jgi:hypothetical protein
MNNVIQADILSHLLSGKLNSLATWFADPMSPDEALACLPYIRRQARIASAGGRQWFEVRLAELIVAYWRGHDTEADYKNLLALAAEQRQQAMLGLCYGQLLLARKRETAWYHLDHGFRLAANLLEADEYFQVLKRHELLHGLPLSSNPSKPATLDELLTEARVVCQLQGRGSRPHVPGSEHSDMID